VRAVYLLLLAVVSLSTIGEDHVKPVWLSTLEEPEPVNFSALPVVIPRPVFPEFVFEDRSWGEGFVCSWRVVRT